MRNYYSILFLVAILFLGCQQEEFEETIVSLDSYKIAAGFNLEVIAAEPLLDAPVTMDFDNMGRMWVVEMRGYMPNLEGIGEEEPNGRITIMEDRDDDGIADHAKVFLDNLVLPRAISHVYGGLLYVEPPNLWFIENENDQPGKKTLVDSLYSTAGNVEHQPNGILMNIDNWIYNANSNFRYKLEGGKWLKEPTSYRGQWGISKDNFGRLYYNGNSSLIEGDYVLPNTVIRNKFYKPNALIKKQLASTRRIYPLHPTSINRGYVPGNLDKDSLVLKVTSGCGPMIYRGGAFPNDYDQNAFTCIPEGNLIKRNILTFEDAKTTAKAAWEEKEFIASTDEAFRPVNLFNGPDGAMYILDMHRGIIQHKAYLTQYLAKQLADKQLDTIKGMGRILKVTNKNNSTSNVPNLTKASSSDLVNLLSNKNGWIRDRAQQLLILNQDVSVASSLEEVVLGADQNSSQLHALYTLKGLNKISFEFILKILNNDLNKQETKAHALLLSENYAESKNIESMTTIVEELIADNNGFLDLYLAMGLHSWVKSSPDTFMSFLSIVSDRYPEDLSYQEAVASSIVGLEKVSYSNELLNGVLTQSIKNKNKNSLNSIFVNVLVKEGGRTNGLKLFRRICGTCHGPSGDGIEGLAPPLRNSEYVSGSIHRLTSIILHGMYGPVHVNGKLYKLGGAMPGLVDNQSISDRDIADIVHYLQKSFVKEQKKISPEEIKALREQKPKQGDIFTEEELKKTKFER